MIPVLHIFVALLHQAYQLELPDFGFSSGLCNKTYYLKTRP